MITLFSRCLLLVLTIGMFVSVLAQDEADIQYDIFNRDDRVHVWLDLSGHLTERAITKLKDGISLLIQYHLSLEVPRKFIGSRQVADLTARLILSYRPISEDWLLTSYPEGIKTSLQFLSLATLYQHLKDSIEIPFVGLDSLDSEERHTLEIEVTTIFLTDLNVISRKTSGDSEESALEYLFRQFLSVTGYGRRDKAIKSRPFSLGELDKSP